MLTFVPLVSSARCNVVCRVSNPAALEERFSQLAESRVFRELLLQPVPCAVVVYNHKEMKTNHYSTTVVDKPTNSYASVANFVATPKK